MARQWKFPRKDALLAFLVVAFVHVCIMLASTRHKESTVCTKVFKGCR